MMRMATKLLKSQLSAPTLLILNTPGSGAFDRSMYCMAGYTDYDVFIVGAAGGRAGNAGTRTWYSTVTSLFGAGGGGGGSLRMQGDLVNLPVKTNYLVPSPGGNGANASSVKAGDGQDGGNAMFNNKYAYGGKGGIGGRYLIDTDGTASSPITSDPTKGGAGGLNSAGLGTAGAGGISEEANGLLHYSFGVTAPYDVAFTTPVAATAGTFVSGGTGDVTHGGGGGGGGVGKDLITDTVTDTAKAGANGNTGGAGGLGVAPTDNGGSGGGADIEIVTGVLEYYGNAGAGKNAQGVVVIKIS